MASDMLHIFFGVLKDIKSREEDSNSTATLTNNPEHPIAQEEIVGEENDKEDDVIGAEEAAKDHVLADGEAVPGKLEDHAP